MCTSSLSAHFAKESSSTNTTTSHFQYQFHNVTLKIFAHLSSWEILISAGMWFYFVTQLCCEHFHNFLPDLPAVCFGLPHTVRSPIFSSKFQRPTHHSHELKLNLSGLYLVIRWDLKTIFTLQIFLYKKTTTTTLSYLPSTKYLCTILCWPNI